MRFSKSLAVLAGAVMVALALAAPVVDAPVDAVAAARETPQAMAKSPAKHTTKAAKAHTTKPVKPHTTTKPAKSPTTKPTKLQTTKPAKPNTTKTAKPPTTTAKLHPTTPVKPPATKSKIKQTKTSAKPVKPPVTKPVKTSTTKPAKPSTRKSIKATTTKPLKSSTKKPVKASTTKPIKTSIITSSLKPTVTKSAKTHTTKSAKSPVAKPSKLSASKSVKTHITKPTKGATSTAKPSGKSSEPAPTKLPSNSTSAAPSKPSSPASCPLPPKAVKKPSVHRRIYESLARLFQRDETLFIGWHGTNDKTATLWETTGHIVKPASKSSVFGGIFGNSGADGSSGADAEFGPGLYVTDDVFTASIYSSKNFKQNNLDAGKAGKPQDYKPKVCAIYAKSKSKWLNQTPKIIIPVSLKGNEQSDEDKRKGIPDPRWEEQRIAYIKDHIVGPPTLDPTTVQRFAALTLPTDKKTGDGPGTGQLILVQGQDYEARCFDPKEDGTTPSGATDSRTYPDFAYMSYALQQEWRVTGMLKAQCLS